MKKRYIELRVILNVFGINLNEIDIINSNSSARGKDPRIFSM